MIFQEDKVITGNVVLAWNGINTPEMRDGKPNYTARGLIAKDAPEIIELQNMATVALGVATKFPAGQMPVNGSWPLNTVADPAKFGPTYTNHLSIGGGTQNMPSVVDANGQLLDPMVYGQQLYPGCIVKLLLHAYDFNTKGNSGIAFGLDGIQIIDATAPRLPVAAGMAPDQVANAFGGQPATPMAVPGTGPSAPLGAVPAAPGPGAPLTPSYGVMTPAATHTYDQYIANGWSDEALRKEGLMV